MANCKMSKDMKMLQSSCFHGVCINSNLYRTFIVLYLCIYIVLLVVHTNQKRFQCERREQP